MTRLSTSCTIPITAVGLGLLLLAFLPPESGAAASGPPPTRVVVFHPSGVRGGTLHGACWTSSSAAFRPDAWRCLAGNAILDPCFSASNRAHSVICQVLPPFTGRGVRLSLTKPLPLAERGAWPRVPHAWIVHLKGGVACTFFESTPPPMANPHATPPSYGCSDRSYLMAPRPGRRWTATRVWLRDAGRGFAIARRQLSWLPTVWE